MRWWNRVPRGVKILFCCSLLAVVAAGAYAAGSGQPATAATNRAAPIGNVATLGGRLGGGFWAAYGAPHVMDYASSAVWDVPVGTVPAGLQVYAVPAADGHAHVNRIVLRAVGARQMDAEAAESYILTLLPSDAHALNVIGAEHPYDSPDLAATFNGPGTFTWHCETDYRECAIVTT